MDKFILSPEILDQIIFAMENQNESYLFDSRDGVVIMAAEREAPEADDDGRYYEIPSWESSDGFNLMEKFVASLRNPVYREQLRDALNSGRGVFRNFKNVLKQRDDIQRLWFSFKDRAMKTAVIEWYNDLCEMWGVEKIGPEPDDTEELVLSDFQFRTDGGECDTSEYLLLDRDGFEEAMADYPPEYVSERYDERMRSLPADRHSWAFTVCETPEGELAGVLWSVNSPREDDAASTVTYIVQLYIRSEFRGLGLAKTMVGKFVEDAYRGGTRQLTVKLWGKNLGFGRIFEECGLTQESAEYSADLDVWGRKNCAG